LQVSQTQHVAKRKQAARCSLTIAKFDIQEETSLDVDYFEELHSILIRTSLVQVGKRPVQTILSTHVRLLMVLHWLQEKPKFRLLAKKFGVAASTIHRDVKFFLPKLMVANHASISWPTRLRNFEWDGAVGSIDCTAHLRTKWYRHDKGFLI
jgi:hypothetical protein